ncbi:Proteolipid protein 2 [Dionaea muscipula]
MERSRSLLQPPTYGNLITVLSIDGGGIKGIVPGILLGYLESELQAIDGPDARIADYFDVISGTSTGGLVTTMLTAPDENNRPLYAAKDIKQFYLDHSPKIFPQSSFSVMSLFRSVEGPKYDGKYLHNLLNEKLGDTRLSQTLTNIVIPTFDIKYMQPVIFSSYEVEKNPCLNARLADICIGTSAAPTYLPAHHFTYEDSVGAVREFHLVDGGMAANNPALVAMNEVTKEIDSGNPDFFPIKPTDYNRFLVLSLGTGSPRAKVTYTAQEAAKWGVVGWLTQNGANPLIDIFMRGSADMIDYHLSAVFQTLRSQENYIRICDDALSPHLATVDVATKENLEGLVEAGEALLEKKVTRVNLNTGEYVPISDHTNKDILKKLARLLVGEKRIRDLRSPHGKKLAGNAEIKE